MSSTIDFTEQVLKCQDDSMEQSELSKSGEIKPLDLDVPLSPSRRTQRKRDRKNTQTITVLSKLEQGFSRKKARKKLLIIKEKEEEESPNKGDQEKNNISLIQPDCEVDLVKKDPCDTPDTNDQEKKTFQRQSEYFNTIKYTKSFEYEGLRAEKNYKNVKWIIFPDDKCFRVWNIVLFM